MALHTRPPGAEVQETLAVNPMFAQAGETTSVPKHRLPDGPMDPVTAYQLVHDHLMLDGNARTGVLRSSPTTARRSGSPEYCTTSPSTSAAT